MADQPLAKKPKLMESNDGASKANESFTSPSPVIEIDTTQYRSQLDTKLGKLRHLFSSLSDLLGENGLPPIDVFESEPSHYRMRAEFTVWGTHPAAAAASAAAAAAADTKPDVHYIMYDTKSGVKPPPRIRIDSFPVGSRLMNTLMTAVREEANGQAVLREKLFQVNFHTTLKGESMVTLVYHKKLDDTWQEAARALKEKLSALPAVQGQTLHVIGRSRKQKLELSASHVEERLEVNGRQYVYRQVEGSFSQPNGGVCQKMLAWAQRVTTPQPGDALADAPTVFPAPAAAGSDKAAAPAASAEAAAPAAAAPAASGADGDSPQAAEQQQQQQSEGGSSSGNGPRHAHDLLELYCGNGNFTCALADNFRGVVATEMAKSSVDAARHNLTANGLTNVFLARMSSEEFTDAWRTKAAKRRLEGLNWDSLQLGTVLVDPPRAGLDDETVKLVAEFDHVVYISCNPETLAANLRVLLATHELRHMAAFDQFPYTHHLECGVYLVKKKR